MDTLIRNLRQVVTVRSDGLASLRGRRMRELSVIDGGAILIHDDTIVWVGSEHDLPGIHQADVFDARGGVAFPGMIDAHTHAIFSGSREDEFAMRVDGATYAEIAAGGGGILRTVQSVRDTEHRQLRQMTSRRLDRFLKYGTTTVEIKSGYGLTERDEMKMLNVAHDCKKNHPVSLSTTLLAAHAVPPEFAGRRSEYVDLICGRMIPYAAEKKIVDWVDVFCDEGFFTVSDTEKIFSTAAAHGLGTRLHTDELASIGGVPLAVRMGAASVDHLERISRDDISHLANSATVATLLPGVSFYLNHGYAPARDLIDAGAAVAIATDYNPGSCMAYSMPLMMTIACTQMRMTPEEAIAASTINAAASLRMSDIRGSIEPGKKADIVIFDVPSYRYVPYEFGGNPVTTVIKDGVILEFNA